MREEEHVARQKEGENKTWRSHAGSAYSVVQYVQEMQQYYQYVDFGLCRWRICSVLCFQWTDLRVAG